MYILNKKVAIAGMAGALISVFLFPFLKVPIKGNWTLYQTDTSLFFISLILLGVAVLVFMLRNIKLFQMLSWCFLIWCLLGLVAVYFKINNYFGMKLVDGLLAKTIQLKWGWAVLLISAILMILSVRKLKQIH